MNALPEITRIGEVTDGPVRVAAAMPITGPPVCPSAFSALGR